MGKKKLACPECSRSFSCRWKVQRHVDSVHATSRPFACDGCDGCTKTFKSSGALRQHRVYKHTEDKPLQCDRCIMTFMWESSRRRHVKLVHESSILLRRCTECGQAFERKIQLDDHLLNAHALIHLFGCDECDKMYSNEPSVRRHKMRAHAASTVSTLDS